MLSFLGALLLLLSYSFFFGKIAFFAFKFITTSFSFRFIFFFDYIRTIFLFTVSLISLLICVYSYYYIQNDTQFYRFLIVLLLFVLSIILIIIRPRLLRILLGWDMLGLTSYALVVYYQNNKRNRSGILTILRNRLGDVFILFSLSWRLRATFFSFFTLSGYEQKRVLIGLFLLFGAITKRAQIPFSSWLPAAISAPTPVSSLVHSSTLVTAGVYLLIRFLPVIERILLKRLFIISLLTIILRRITGILERDLKKIIAFSTLSQLGFIIIILSIKINYLCFFHLITHAFFKSIIFLCAGILIHSFNTQRIKIFGRITKLSLVKRVFLLSRLSIRGFLFFSGFFSKDLILDMLFTGSLNHLFYFIIIIRIVLTIFYRFRIISLAFVNSINKSVIEFNFSNILIPLVVLGAFSLYVGNIIIWKFTTLRRLFSDKKLFIFFLIFLSIRRFLIFLEGQLTSHYFSTIWFLNNFLSLRIIPLIKKEYFLDKTWIEFIGSKNLYLLFSSSSRILSFWESKSLKIILYLLTTWLILFAFII